MVTPTINREKKRVGALQHAMDRLLSQRIDQARAKAMVAVTASPLRLGTKLGSVSHCGKPIPFGGGSF